MKSSKPTSIDEYIAGFPKATQKPLEQIRQTVRKVAPGAEETISYSMPTFTLEGRYLVYFAGFKNHIGFYPAPIGIEEFEKELSGYKTGRGSVQFPLDKPMPLDLVRRIVKFRIRENLGRAKRKK